MKNRIIKCMTIGVMIFTLNGCASANVNTVALVEEVQTLQEQESAADTVKETQMSDTAGSTAETSLEISETEDVAVSSKLCFVHICGAVAKPGVYQIENGMRLYQVVDLAEGFTKQADNDYVNLAAVVMDGQKIYIPTVAEIDALEAGTLNVETQALITGTELINAGSNGAMGSAQAIGTVENAQTDETLVNINQASESELCTLTGVGESRAKSIIEYRESNGGFSTIEDIMKVTGIKEGLFNKIKDQITV